VATMSMTPPDPNDRPVPRAPGARRRAILTLIALVVAAIAIWGLGIMLFPVFGDRSFYPILLSLLGIGVWVVIVGMRLLLQRSS
jgi:hypothetical protein